MSAREEQSKANNSQQKRPDADQSPTEKLQDEPTGSQIPGAENPESTEVKKEKKWNTE